MKYLLLSLAALLLGAAPVAAQNSAACATPQLSGNVNTPTATFNFYSCTAVVDAADGIAIRVNGNNAALIFQTPTPEAASASGKVAHPVSVTLSGRGNHTIETAPFTLTSGGSRQVGPFSTPFVLVYEKPVPATATTNHLR